MGMSVLPDMCALVLRAADPRDEGAHICGPQDKGAHIRENTCAHVTTITYVPL